MTEPVDVLIQAALCTRLVGASSGTQIAMPLVEYSPVIGTPYLDARAVLRAAPESPSIAFTGSVKFPGIFQVDAVVPDGQGEAPGLRLASLVAARFAQGTRLVAGSRWLTVMKTPTIAAAIKDASWIRYPVSIPYLVIA